MSALGGSPLDSSGGERGDRRVLRYLIPAGLVVLLVAMIVVIASSTGGSQGGSSSAGSRAADGGKLPLYWTVRRGQTYAQIAKKTGLSIAQLNTLNPSTDPRSLVPGRRLKLRLDSPVPHPKPLGPRFWTVRSGQSFGSIAAKTAQSIVTLEHLNPQLKATTLQPGDQVRLRP